MQAYHPGTGMTLEFPDNTPDEAIQQHFQNAQMNMPSTAPSVAQQFLDGARSAMDQQQAAPAPLNGRGFVGLDPQQAQFMLQQRQNQAAMQQQAASEETRNRMQQQQLDQNQLENEKNRATTISLATQRMKNDMAIDKAKQQAAEHAAAMKEKGVQVDHQHDLTLEEIRQKGREALLEKKNAAQKEVAGMRAANSNKPQPVRLVSTEKTRAMNSETGQMEDVIKEYYSDGTFDYTPAPSASAPGGAINDYQVLGMIQAERKAIDAQQASSLLEEGEPGYVPPDQREEIARKRVMDRIQQIRGGGQQPAQGMSTDQAIEFEAQLGRDLAAQKALGKNARIIGNEVVIFP